MKTETKQRYTGHTCPMCGQAETVSSEANGVVLSYRCSITACARSGGSWLAKDYPKRKKEAA